MPDSAGDKILYVEDEPLIREVAITALQDAGYVVDALPSGQAAVAILEERGSDFRALVTDIDLGAGPRGWDVARHARRKHPGLPIVYVSGGSCSDWTLMGVPGSVMLPKPYASAQLVAAVSRAISPARRQTPAELG